MNHAHHALLMLVCASLVPLDAVAQSPSDDPASPVAEAPAEDEPSEPSGKPNEEPVDEAEPEEAPEPEPELEEAPEPDVGDALEGEPVGEDEPVVVLEDEPLAGEPPEEEGPEDVDGLDVQYGDILSTFTFGSYARVRAASDLNGGTARQVNVVSQGSRIDENNYAELEFQQLFELPESADTKFYLQAVTTLALGADLFHFTGDFDQAIAARNMYGEGGWRTGSWTIAFWAGSRMYRGDDIYLLDFWPLDNLNTVGGGGILALDWDLGRTELKLHSGVNRLLNLYQFQQVDVPSFDFGADDVVFLNRLRTISSARLQQDLWLSKRADGSPKTGAKLMLYAEDHRLPQGERRLEDGVTTETVPEESGGKVGAELGLWTAEGFFKGSFANLFFVQSWGLAAYGEFGVPTGLNVNETSEGANQTMVALSADLETPYAGLLMGAYYKYFQDADRDAADFDDYWESIFAARAHWYATRHIHPGIELSYQLRRPAGPFVGTNAFEVPAVTKVSFIQALTLDKGMYSRPQVRFIYTLSMLNESAQALYNPQDPRRQMANQHYAGVMVEWWFNNASLFRP